SEAARAALADRMSLIASALERGDAGGVDVKLGDAADFGSQFGDSGASDADGPDGSDVSAPLSGPVTADSDAPPVAVPAMTRLAADGSARLHMRV
ncbi:MAG: hypothetical protein WBA35_06420, partial [Litorimonas sp.]